MATEGNIFDFEVWNDDVRLRFSCDKSVDRIRKAVENLSDISLTLSLPFISTGY